MYNFVEVVKRVIISKKVRLKPTKEQEIQLWKSAGTARWTYNWVLNKQEENYKNGGKFISDNDLRKEITKLKQTDNSSGYQTYRIMWQNKL